jgi:PAS domain S-box-containing protein
MEKLYQGTTPHHVHQQTDESLRASEERFRALADTVPAIVWTATPDGTITFANEQWFQYCGLTPEQNARHWLEFVIHPDDRQRCLTAWSQALTYGSRYEIEVRNRRHDGVYRWFLTRAMPVRDTAGRITEWYGTTTDIHDRKQAEEQLQRKTEDLVRLNAELERSNAELEAFASIVSHDLKEPLRGIRNYAYFLLEDYKDTLDTEGVAKLQTLTRLTQRMEALIESLLRYSSIGRDELTPHETDLNLVVREALELLKARLEDSDVEVRLPRLLPIVRGDRVQLTEVFTNLLSNAMKYNDKAEKWVEIGVQENLQSGAAPVFSVRDNGIGIAPQHWERIFTIFRRLHAHEAFGGGVGAGLTIVKKIVERHGGRIWVESTPGQGSIFYFTLGQ